MTPERLEEIRTTIEFYEKVGGELELNESKEMLLEIYRLRAELTRAAIDTRSTI